MELVLGVFHTANCEFSQQLDNKTSPYAVSHATMSAKAMGTIDGAWGVVLLKNPRESSMFDEYLSSPGTRAGTRIGNERVKLFKLKNKL